MRLAKQLGLVAAVAVALAMAGGSQEPLTTTDIAVSVEGEIYFAEWQGTVALSAGDAQTELPITGLWTLLLQPSNEGQARVSLNELLVFVPEFSVSGMSGSGFFVTESRVTSFQGSVDLATKAFQLRGSVNLTGLVRGLDSMAVEVSGSFRTGTFSFKGAGTAAAGTAVIAGNGVVAVGDMKEQAKTWKHYALSDLVNPDAAKATCCGCETLVITTGGKRIKKVSSTSKQLVVSRGDYTTGEKAVVLVYCKCCDIEGETAESLITVNWEDKAGKGWISTPTVVCKKPQTYQYERIPAPFGAKAPLDCKAGECLLVTFDSDLMLVRSVSMKKTGSAVSAAKGSVCCKQTNSVFIQCACSAAACDATVVVKVYDKKKKAEVELEIPVSCK